MNSKKIVASMETAAKSAHIIEGGLVMRDCTILHDKVPFCLKEVKEDDCINRGVSYDGTDAPPSV